MTAVAPVRIEIIIGSVRVGRIAPVVAGWFAERARAYPGLDVGIIDLADTPLPQDLGASPATDEFRERVGRADGFVAVTSEYNHGYPAALKTAFDSVKHEWRSKPIGFVSYGGLAGGLRGNRTAAPGGCRIAHGVGAAEREFPPGAQAIRRPGADDRRRRHRLGGPHAGAAGMVGRRGPRTARNHPVPRLVGPGRVVARQTNSARTAVTFTGECDQPGHTTIGKKPRNATAQVFNRDSSPRRAFGA